MSAHTKFQFFRFTCYPLHSSISFRIQRSVFQCKPAKFRSLARGLEGSPIKKNRCRGLDDSPIIKNRYSGGLDDSPIIKNRYSGGLDGSPIIKNLRQSVTLDDQKADSKRRLAGKLERWLPSGVAPRSLIASCSPPLSLVPCGSCPQCRRLALEFVVPSSLRLLSQLRCGTGRTPSLVVQFPVLLGQSEQDRCVPW